MHYLRTALSKLDSFFDSFRSAKAVAGAVERGARPDTRDLRLLGIDPEAFFAIGRGTA
jgi:hypothetical protein